MIFNFTGYGERKKKNYLIWDQNVTWTFKPVSMDNITHQTSTFFNFIKKLKDVKFKTPLVHDSSLV